MEYRPLNDLEIKDEFIAESIFDSFKDSLEFKEDIDQSKVSEKLEQIIPTPTQKSKLESRKQNKLMTLATEKSIFDQWSLSKEKQRELILEFEGQKEELIKRKYELRADFVDWQKENQQQLDLQKNDLTTKQENIKELENKNRKLEMELQLKLEEFERQSKELKKEREKLSTRELELEKKVTNYDNVRVEFEKKLKKIELDTTKLDEQREKLYDTQKQFAKQVKVFEKSSETKSSQKLKDEMEKSQEELTSEWMNLRKEEKRLNQVRAELMHIKSEFTHRFSSERNELDSERERLTKEWDKLKITRKNLEFSMPALESKLKKILEVETKSKRKLFKKLKPEEIEHKISQLESKLLGEISEEISKAQVGSTEKLASEWAKLHAEENRLTSVHHEILQLKNEVQDHFIKERKELNQKRRLILEEWEKLKELQNKSSTDVAVVKDSGPDKKIKPTETFELDSKLKALQGELRAEWTELRSQRENLSKALKKFSKAKLVFDRGKKEGRKKAGK